VDVRRLLAPLLLAAAGCAAGRLPLPGGAAPGARPSAIPGPATGRDPTLAGRRDPAGRGADDADVEALLSTLTLEEKVAQLVLAFPPGGDGPVDQGGVILLGRVLRDPAALRAQVAALQRRARLPLLVAVDLEGGELNRLKALRTMAAFPSARELGGEGTWEAEAWGRRAGLDLAALGVNVSLGPVLDLADRGFMFETGRSLGADPVRVARLAGGFARGLASAGVLPVGKHYPGYGPLAGSSDRALQLVELGPQEIAAHEAAFVQAADALFGVMLANVAYRGYGGVPAVLSPALVARAHLSGFLAVTDDLAVPSLREAVGGDAAELWRRAFLAGNDLLLTTAPCRWPGAPDPRQVLLSLLAERPGLVPRLDESVRRVLAAKIRLGLLGPRAAPVAAAGPAPRGARATAP
jgi:beta-N-acetylhexosaminidase